ncbi:LacI family DNA-binding transcriptional regulator [Sphingomonas sp. H39-1-10]|uniref:LacI family DNA-binding transcriptional regulator n=1 Tax=Sphingomonas TaxID=13687 RepID=UPI000B89EF0C|nr:MULTISPECIES: LacI family DNA-binding transcriptional regulator [Sphingomonas]MDF0488525.1 LacI family DNA-binding transcriptional regulator [Sphingomonas pollutisoli]
MAVGIKDVAKVAQVSPATVSRVLAGRPVDPAMKDRVQAAVKSTGYRPNLAARRLRSQHTNTIGLIVADIRNPYFTSVSRTIERVAAERGFSVILSNTDEDPAQEAKYLELMQQERVAGVILAPSRQRVDRAGKLSLDCPVVLIDRAMPQTGHDCVLLDNEAMAALLVEHLHAEGHRHIAGLFGAASSTGVARRAGFERAADQLGMNAAAVAIPHESDAAERVVAELLQGAKRPDALVASNGVMVLTVLRALRTLGLDVPRDIALAGFDNNDWMEFVGEGLTVIEQPVEEIGRTAMTMLFDRFDHPGGPARRVVLDGRLIARGSSTLAGNVGRRGLMPPQPSL